MGLIGLFRSAPSSTEDYYWCFHNVYHVIILRYTVCLCCLQYSSVYIILLYWGLSYRCSVYLCCVQYSIVYFILHQCFCLFSLQQVHVVHVIMYIISLYCVLPVHYVYGIFDILYNNNILCFIYICLCCLFYTVYHNIRSRCAY